MSFCFIVVVWGDAYVEMLLHVSLRCFLSPKNIPGLSDRGASKFVFVTTREDYANISQSAIFKTLATYIEPVFIELDMSGDENVYARMTIGYEQATRLACQHKAYAVYLLPDCLVSEGTFCQLEKYARAGKDVVLLPGPRLIKEEVMSYVSEMHLEDGAALDVTPRSLAKMALSFLHQEFKNYNYNPSMGFTKWPQMVSWNIPNQSGLLIRAFHLHPLMVNCSDQTRGITFHKDDTIDDGFIKRNFLDLNRFLLETDSDNMMLFSLTKEQDRIESDLVWGIEKKLETVLEMSQRTIWINELHKIYFYNAYKLHDSELNATWLEVERDSLSIAASILMYNPSLARVMWRYIKSLQNRSFLYLKGWRRLLNVLPPRVKTILKHVYWKAREVSGWIKIKRKYI